MDRQEFIRKREQHLDHWTREIDELESRLNQMEHEQATDYQTRITGLRDNLARARAKLVKVREADTESSIWNRLQVDLQHEIEELERLLAETRRVMLGTTEPILGWPEGQASHAEHDSEGWAEGQGHQERQSEGWSEGQGHRQANSVGFAEGQSKRSSPEE